MGCGVQVVCSGVCVGFGSSGVIQSFCLTDYISLHFIGEELKMCLAVWAFGLSGLRVRIAGPSKAGHCALCMKAQSAMTCDRKWFQFRHQRVCHAEFQTESAWHVRKIENPNPKLPSNKTKQNKQNPKP